jgi:hypothetical protein
MHIPQGILTTVISTSAIILSALIGGVCSWLVTKNSTYKQIQQQIKFMEDNKKREEYNKEIKICEYANIIRLDICTVLFQSIRTLKSSGDEFSRFPIPIDREFSKAVVSLTDRFNLKEMSYIYQLYGIIEKLNSDINKLDYYNKEAYELIKRDHIILLNKLYGSNADKVLKMDIDKITFEELYNNDLIKVGYRNVLKKLDDICNLSCNNN